MGRTKVLDQGFAGLMLQVFQCGCPNCERWLLGTGLELTGMVVQQPKNDLAHGYSSIPKAILGPVSC